MGQNTSRFVGVGSLPTEDAHVVVDDRGDPSRPRTTPSVQGQGEGAWGRRRQDRDGGDEEDEDEDEDEDSRWAWWAKAFSTNGQEGKQNGTPAGKRKRNDLKGKTRRQKTSSSSPAQPPAQQHQQQQKEEEEGDGSKRHSDSKASTFTKTLGLARGRKKQRLVGKFPRDPAGENGGEGSGSASARVHFVGGDIQDRLSAAPSKAGFRTLHSVHMKAFSELYGDLQEKLSKELFKGSKSRCDVSLDGVLPVAMDGAQHQQQGERAFAPEEGRVQEIVEEAQDIVGRGPSSSSSQGMEKSRSWSLSEKVQPNEIILKVAVYHPEKPSRKIQEILVLGSQKLTVLRDKIHWHRDDISKMNKMHVPSAFLFIEGTFYDDMRDPAAVRYSDNIMDFIKHKSKQGKFLFKKKKGMAGQKKEEEEQGGIYWGKKGEYQFRQEKMEEVTFNQLQLKLGSSNYVYCHQGICEHHIAFLDVRMVHNDDVQLASQYPVSLFQKMERRHKCMICAVDEGRYLVYGDDMSPCSPCVFCEGCLQALHGNKPEDSRTFGLYEYPRGIPREC